MVERKKGRAARHTLMMSSLPTVVTVLAGLASAATAVVLSTGESNTCPAGYGRITVESECVAAMPELGMSGAEYQGTETESSWPAGCYFCNGVAGCTDGVWFNTHETGSGASGGASICASTGPPPPPTAAPPPTTAPPPGVLFVGDSDIDYWATAGVFPGSANVGVAGWTCNNVKNRVAGFLATHTPTQVVLVCGENDLAYGASVATTFSRFSQVVASITDAGARVVYMGTKPEPDTTSLHPKYREYDALIRGLASELAAAAGSSAGAPPLAMVDVYPGFVALGNPSSLYYSDGLHLSNAGYGHWNGWAATALAAAAAGGGCTLWESGGCTAQSPTPPPTPSPTPSPSPSPTPSPPPSPTPAPTNYCQEGYDDFGVRYNAPLGKITIANSHAACSARCTQYSDPRWNGGCKGYQTGMYFGMLYCRSYGYNARTTPCAYWAHPSDPGVDSGALGSTHARTNVVNRGGNCCSNITFVEASIAAAGR